MIVIRRKVMHHAEPCMVTGVLQRVWRDVREDRKDKFVREFEDCIN